MPNVSVVIPTYNRADYLHEAITSVLSQSYRDFEIIVVDDGSTDDTRRVLEHFIAEGSIQYIYQTNAGGGNARDTGIQAAQGKYIALLDSDDLFLPNKLEKQIAFLEEYNEAGMVHSGFSKFDNTGKDLGYRDSSRFSGWIYPNLLLEWSVLIASSTVVMPSSVLQKIGRFDDSTWAADLDMWRRIARRYLILTVPENLAKIRVHAGGMSSDKTGIAARFLKYFDKAFLEDPTLSNNFRRRALSKMHANVGHNLLGEGESEHMGYVRQNSVQAIRLWPYTFGAYAGYIGSFLNQTARKRLFRSWRNFRYHTYRE